ncbi:MAG: hypothetical protein WAM11_13465 [Cyanobium sp.]
MKVLFTALAPRPSGAGMTGIIKVLLVGEIEQGTLGVHPHLSQLFIGHAALLGFHQTLIGMGPYGDAAPTLKLQIVKEQLNAGITAQDVIGKLQPLEIFQTAKG